MEDSAYEHRSPLPLYLALAAVAYVSVAGITTVFSMLSLLYRQFDDPFRIGWVVSGYFLVSAISAAICGRFGDLIGRRRMTLIILPLAGIGALISATSTTLDGVIAGCAIQGVAGALTPLILGIAREALPPSKVPFAVGVINAALVAGGGLSFLVAGFFIDHYSWTGGFYMKVVLVPIAVAAVLAFVPDRRRPDDFLGKVNVSIGVLFAPAIAGLFVADQLALSQGWNSPGVIATLGGSIALLGFWGRHQARQEFPLIDVGSLARRPVLLGNLCIGFLALGCMQHGQLLSLYLQQPVWTQTGFGLKATLSGGVLVPLLSVALIASPLSGIITARHGARKAALVGFVLGASAWIANTAYHQSFWLFMTACVLGVMCIAMVQPAVYNLIIEATAEERTSEAVGMTNIFISVFMAIGAHILSALLASSQISDVTMGPGTYPTDNAYTLTFGYMALMSVLGLLTAFSLPRPARPARTLKAGALSPGQAT